MTLDNLYLFFTYNRAILKDSHKYKITKQQLFPFPLPAMDQTSQSYVNATNRTLGFQFFSQPTEDMIHKRRRLSEQSNSSESTGEKQLNESFKKMEIQTNFSSISCPSPSSDNPVIFKCPKPIRLPKHLVKSEDTINHHGQKPITSILDQLGIQKYLTLDCDLKLKDIQAQQYISKNTIQVPKKPPPFIYPYGVPANFDFIMKESQEFLKQQIKDVDTKMKDDIEREHFISSLNIAKVPKLTKEERANKVALYLEKKHNRQWKAIRYFHRQNLAEKRDRVQGRFVKSQHPRIFSHSEEEPLSNSWGGSSAGNKKMQKGFDKHLEVLKNSQNT